MTTQYLFQVHGMGQHCFLGRKKLLNAIKIVFQQLQNSTFFVHKKRGTYSTGRPQRSPVQMISSWSVPETSSVPMKIASILNTLYPFLVLPVGAYVNSERTATK
jgi:hypothetical protein